MPTKREYRTIRISLQAYKSLKKLSKKEGKTLIRLIDEKTK